MFISKKHLPRRTFLRNLGVGVGLPLLDAMIPAATALAQTAASAPPRMGFIYFPHGAVMSNWTPDQQGRDFELKSILQPLAPFKNALTIVSGLENKRANGPVHAITPGTWLHGNSPRVSHDPYGGTTIDQIAAQHIGQDTPLPSIEVATELTGGSGQCDRDYGCSYGATISFRTPSTPLPMENNPRKLFQTLFGVGDSAEERAAIADQTKSVLDLIMEQTHALNNQLGAADRVILSDYLESVREIERRIQKSADHDLSNVELPDAPLGIPAEFDEHINLQFDLITLAWQADMTRIASMMMAAEVSTKTYNHIGISDAFHPLSHHQNDPAKIARLVRVQEYHSRVFARFVQNLADTPAGDGSLLDNSIILYGSNMSNSNAHDHFPLPSAIVGTGGGRIRGGQHLVYPDYTPVSNLMLTLMDRIGVELDSLGDSTGRFAEV